MKKLTLAVALLLTTIGVNASADKDTDAIAKRIAPVGQVYLAGAAPAAAAQDSGPRSGEQVYQSACFACHGTGALDAPKPQSAEWKPRLEQGFDVLLRHSIDGIRNMPAMGTCANCSEDEIAAAIRFMTDGV
ncbi:cytochrome c [Alishewanella longhuensis]|uniref:Cytochrome c n=1 Tax=Alishewanella longhuensis TaxID=1091037 RepID=A0ABQ3KTU0_9ALTE|nr:c-type cytochrome [Alishewanella longhuensis]GHG59531.1 cytochrome c [Alishewanella longhuensis]